MPDLVATDRSFGTTCLTGACAGSSVLAATALSDFDSFGNRSLCAAWGVHEEDEEKLATDDDDNDDDDDDDFDDDDLDDEEFLDDEDDEDDEDFDEDDDEIKTGDDVKL